VTQTDTPRPRLRDRDTGDLLVLIVAGTICGVVIFTAVGSFAFKLLNPDADINKTFVLVADILNTLIGLLAGFLAGRAEVGAKRRDS
jgi:hypothetical protein